MRKFQATQCDDLKVLVAHSGKQHAYRHALAVQAAGCLHRFVTSSYYKPEALPDRWLSRVDRFDRPLRRRWQEGLDTRRVVRRWRLEAPEILARALLKNGDLAASCMFRRDAQFDRWVARRWAESADIYWGFQGSCLESLQAARAASRTAVAEFATAHVTKAIEVLQAESDRHPEWAHTISNFHFPDWYRERLEQEPVAADYCIAASQFTRQSLLDAGVDDARIRLLPLGADVSRFACRRRTADGPFRILFVGGIGQRKGVKYLLEAVRRMRSPNVELRLVGPPGDSGSALQPYHGLYEMIGRVDQAEVVRRMHESHVMVLPSVFEGFGLVIPEAMATGMPVIASTHSIGPEIIRDGVDGFVLSPDDIEGLADKLDWLASHREAAVEMGQSASRQAQQLSWEAHGRRVAELLAGMSEPAPLELVGAAS